MSLNDPELTPSKIQRSRGVHDSAACGLNKPIPPQVTLGEFSEEERQLILSVVQRDLEMRSVEKHRQAAIRDELLKEDLKAPLNVSKGLNTCTICSSQFIRIINPRITCGLCKREICKRCSSFISGDCLCGICSLHTYYKSTLCQWFYDHSRHPHGIRHASGQIVQGLFKHNHLRPAKDMTEENLHAAVSLYIGPSQGAYINGKFVDSKVMRRIQNEQIRVFSTKYNGIRNASIKALLNVRSTTNKINSEEEVEKTTSTFLQQTRKALEELLQALYVTIERSNVMFAAKPGQSTHIQVLETTKNEIERIVGHSIQIPKDIMSTDVNEDIESIVASVTEGPENFFAQILLENLKRTLRNKSAELL